MIFPPLYKEMILNSSGVSKNSHHKNLVSKLEFYNFNKEK